MTYFYQGAANLQFHRAPCLVRHVASRANNSNLCKVSGSEVTVRWRVKWLAKDNCCNEGTPLRAHSTICYESRAQHLYVSDQRNRQLTGIHTPPSARWRSASSYQLGVRSKAISFWSATKPSLRLRFQCGDWDSRTRTCRTPLWTTEARTPFHKVVLER